MTSSPRIAVSPDFRPDFSHPHAPRCAGRGLVAAVAQDAASGEILMLGWMDEEAWNATLSTGEAHYFSRSRAKLWHKGESSGNVQKVRAIRLDCDADAVVLESNYDPDMLRAGPYPYALKQRILGRRGHLANDDAGRAAVELVRRGARQIILGHLSKENNFPALAETCCTLALEGEGVCLGEDASLRVAERDGLTGMFSVQMRL